MAVLLQAAIVLLPCLLMVLISSLLTCKRRGHRRQHGMRVPLLASEDNAEHRVNAATRYEQQPITQSITCGMTARPCANNVDAESGFTVCLGCEFENFKRYAYCSLCGEKLLVQVTAANGGETNEKSGIFIETGSAIDSGVVTADGVTSGKTQMRTARQLRVRKRKEWVRKVGVDGNLFWYRSSVESGGGATAEAQQPGYVAVFQCAEPAIATKETSLLDERRSGRISSHEDDEDDDDALAFTIDQQSKFQPLLIVEDDTTKIEVVNAAQVDPAAHLKLPANAIEKHAKLNEIIELAARDFPTKYVHFVVSTAALIVPAEVTFLKLSVHRDYMLEESVDHVGCMTTKDVHSYIRITFLDESGVDAGGVYREWFMLVNEELLNPTLGLFHCTNKAEQSYYLNPNSAFGIGEDQHLAYYFAAGRLIGRALLEGSIWGFHLALPLIKIILGIPVTFSDLEFFDPEMYKNLQWIMENDGVEDLGLDFSVTEKQGDDLVTVDLVPNGRNIDLTDANKREYLERRFRYVLFESVSSQLYAFLRGLHEVIPQELLMLFDAQEFDYLLCGTQEIDVDDWKAHTVSQATNLKWNDVLTWFWEVVAEMPNEYRRRLLLFATGSSRVPLGGFAGLTSYDGRLCPFTLKAVSYYSTQYISSHACFNRLDVPLYRSKAELKTMLLAILDTDLYGFTIA